MSARAAASGSACSSKSCCARAQHEADTAALFAQLESELRETEQAAQAWLASVGHATAS
ncbi:hypothetical protein LP420_02815 [Massilia sp. B-10]|nr:hypothetical protein LP420_02815 [Massilia sp. B-10]